MMRPLTLKSLKSAGTWPPVRQTLNAYTLLYFTLPLTGSRKRKRTSSYSHIFSPTGT